MVAKAVTMKHRPLPILTASLAAMLVLASAPVAAEMAAPGSADGAYLECVPYARQVSGIRIFGDAHTWWDQAEGHYARGHAPRVGAVMAFEPHRNMVLGHVAAVSRVVDARTVLIRHANWSQLNGRRGQIEDDVRAVDVSPANDWSQVRVWYGTTNSLGTTAWPVHGFIYPDHTPVMRAPRPQVAAAPARAQAPAPAAAPAVAPSSAPSSARAPTRAAPQLAARQQPAARAAPPAARAAPPAARAAPPAAARRGRDFASAMAMDGLAAEDSFEGSFSGLR